jgi:pimeloyl-ACP methyl ester carboxylesterase
MWDWRALADAHGWRRFAIFGGSGGGPHALACAALLADRVTRCAVLAGIRFADPGKAGPRRVAVRGLLLHRDVRPFSGCEGGSAGSDRAFVSVGRRVGAGHIVSGAAA